MNTATPMDTNTVIRTAVVGMTAPAAGTTISLLNHIEAWFRTGSVIVGFAIGCIALVRLIRNKSPNNKKEDE